MAQVPSLLQKSATLDDPFFQGFAQHAKGLKGNDSLTTTPVNNTKGYINATKVISDKLIDKVPE